MRGFPSPLLLTHNLRVMQLITTSSFQIRTPFPSFFTAASTTTTLFIKSCRPNNYYYYYCSCSAFFSLPFPGNSVLGYSRSLSFSANVSSSGINEVGWKDPTNYRSSPPRSTEVSYQEYQEPLVYGQQQQEQQARFIPVNAFYLCTSVDLKGLQSRRAVNVIPPSSRAANYVVLKYPRENGPKSTLESGDEFSYVVVFQYGSVVLFNVADHEVDAYLEIVKEHGFGHLPEMRKDDYAVVEKPSLQTWMQDGLDFIVLKSLNIDGIRTIGSVLGQSVALDYYVRQVDGMVAEFTAISREMETTGTFTMKRKKLFQLVGKANTNLADVILKLGILERSDIAWKNANYAQIWEYLKDEFELTQRFGSLDFKLKFVEHNIRFLQEILQNRKSDFLEWIIIILISVEILIALYNMLH